jgi:DNA-binding XRE family transcriptional regulator
MKKAPTRLRVLRAEQDVTQTFVARHAGLSASRYWQIEKGEGPEARDRERDAIARVLRVKVTDIAWPEHVSKVERAS